MAQTEAQRAELERLYERCRGELGVPVRWVGREEVRGEEAVRAVEGVLESCETGIVDSHGLMIALEGLVEEAGGTVAVGSAVVGVEPVNSRDGSGGWRVKVRTEDGQESEITAEVVVNAAGLGAVAIRNMVAPLVNKPPMDMFYAKGNYFSYSSSSPSVSRLIYPAPEPGLGGLGRI